MIRERRLFSTPNPNDPEFLVGSSREQIFQQLMTTLDFTTKAETTSLLMIMGPYGSGKTHLLQWFSKQAREKDSKLVLFYTQASSYDLSFSLIVGRCIEEIRRATMKDDDLKEQNLSREYMRDDRNSVHEMVQIIRRLHKKGYSFCLIIDEFENSWNSMDIIYRIRELVDMSPPGLLVVLSAAATEFEAGQVSGPLQARASRILFLEPFSVDDAFKLIKSCTTGETVFSEPAIRLINSVANGIPRKIIGLAHATIALLEIRGQYTVMPRDIRKTLSNEQYYVHYRTSESLVIRQKIIPYLLFFDTALVSLIGYYLIFVANQPLNVVVTVCLLMALVLYPIERLILEILGRDSLR